MPFSWGGAMMKPEYSKTDHMWFLDDGAKPSTKKAAEALERCKAQRRGLWLRSNHLAVFNSDYEATLKERMN